MIEYISNTCCAQSTNSIGIHYLIEIRDLCVVSFCCFILKELFGELQTTGLNAEHLKRVLSFGFAIQRSDSKINLPDFPLDSMYNLVQILVSDTI